MKLILDGKEMIKTKTTQFYNDSIVIEFYDGKTSHIIKNYQLKELYKSGRLKLNN